ncbi:hypothetical protein BH23GEM6_BH23GEM6_18830 [soil metagenome]
MAKIDSFLQHLVQHDGSDLHLSCGDVPMIRQHGAIQRVRYRPLTKSDLESLLFEVLTAEQKERLRDHQRSRFRL